VSVPGRLMFVGKDIRRAERPARTNALADYEQS